MTTNIASFFNAETGENVEREMNSQELAQLQKDVAEFLEHKKLQETLAAEKAALLAKLGITEDEARLLLS